MKDKNRNFGLDFMRATAVVIVLMHHWLGEYAARYFYFSVLGFYGVEIFFVLSGFLIGNILIKGYLYEPEFTFKAVGNFWVRRWMRTLPLYYFILFIYLIIYVQSEIPVTDIWKYFFFVQNITSYFSNNDFYGVSWSLSVEEWFYLSFPVILIAYNFIFKSFLSKVNILFLVIATYLIGCLGIRFLYASDSAILWNNDLRKAVVCREDSISFGVLLALLNLLYKEKVHQLKNISAVFGGLLLAVGIYVFLSDVALNYSSNIVSVSLFSKTVLFTIVSLGSMLILPYFYYIKVNDGWFKGLISYTSKISYSLYLVHLFVLHVVKMIFPPGPSLIFVLGSLVMFIVISMIVSTITFNMIEQTFLRLRDKFSSEKHKPV